MNRKVLLIGLVLAAIIALSGVYIFFGNVGEHKAYIDIKYEGAWEGTIGHDSKTRSVNGYGYKMLEITWTGSKLKTIMAHINKADALGLRLWVGILDSQKQLVTEDDTSAPYGEINLSWKCS